MKLQQKIHNCDFRYQELGQDNKLLIYRNNSDCYLLHVNDKIIHHLCTFPDYQ